MVCALSVELSVVQNSKYFHTADLFVRGPLIFSLSFPWLPANYLSGTSTDIQMCHGNFKIKAYLKGDDMD